MRALSTKLVRETWAQRGQVISIAAVVAVGVMTVLTMRGAYESLVVAQAQYYRDARFPDVWASLERAPEALRQRIEAVPDVAAVDTRVTLAATLDVPGIEAPALGQFVSVPDGRRPRLADLHITRGRYLAPGRRDEVLVSVNFAEANAFVPGDTLRALLNGRYRDLQIVGMAITPEYTYAVPPGSLFPDDQRFGVVWMGRDALGPAADLDGAFNSVVLTLARGADEARVLDALDRLLDPYGGRGAHGRADQPSHAILQAELDQNRSNGTVIPIVFLLVAAFLLHIVLGRMIATQRTEIAVLKAFGYTDAEVGTHYLAFALLAVALGAVAGVGLGIWTGRGMIALYADSFDFPDLRFILQPGLVGIAVLVSGLAAGVGALGAVRRAASLPPAEAMRPEPPASFRPGLAERLGLGHVIPAAGRMILRNVERTPVRSLLSAIGVGFAVAILIVGMFMFDGVERMIDLQFRVAQREDLAVTFNRPVSLSVRHDLDRLGGVTHVEPFRAVPVRFVAGHRQREAGLTGVVPDGRLRRIVTADGGIVPVPTEGIVMSQFLAERLGVTTGDRLTVEVLEGERRTAEVPVAGVVEDFLGVSATMRLDALHRLVRGPRSISGAYLAVEPGAREALNARLKRLPVVASVASPEHVLQEFETQLAEGLFISVFFILGFSAVISTAVVYNGARVALSERGRELASLRVLGFSRREVAVLLLGEQGLTTLLGIPLGIGIGTALAAAVAAGIQTETYRIPFLIDPATYAWAGLITVVAALLSGLLVRRRLDRMDLVDVLKTRE